MTPEQLIGHPVVLRALGVVGLVADRSWPEGLATVVEVVDADGDHWMVKQNVHRRSHERERDALLHWAPALGAGRVPTLRDHDDADQVLVTDRLSGTSGTASTVDHHRQAGVLCARLHALPPHDTVEHYGDQLRAKLDDQLVRVPGVLDRGTVDLVHAWIDVIDTLPPPRTGPTHGDYQPRNWLVDEGGTVAVIDFGRTEVDVQLRDLERMWFAEWAGRPDLRDGFLDGYGPLTEDDERQIVARGAFQGAGTVLWSREHQATDFEAHGRRILHLVGRP